MVQYTRVDCTATTESATIFPVQEALSKPKIEPYHFPGYQDLPGVDGFSLNALRFRVDNPQLFSEHVKKYIPPYLQALSDELPVELKDSVASVLASNGNLQQELSFFVEKQAERAISVPQWIQELKRPLYQIMVDRFANPNLWSEDKELKDKTWNRWQELQNRKHLDQFDNLNFAGGTIQGVLDRLDYIKSFAGGVYLNPIYESNSIHGYDASDYFSISHRLSGISDDEYNNADEQSRQQMKAHGMELFLELTGKIPIVMDIAVNHSGQGFRAFQTLRQNGINSKDGQYYKDWYRDSRYDSEGRLTTCKKWWGHDTLPELDHHTDGVTELFLGEAYQPGKSLEDQTQNWKQIVAFMKIPEYRNAIIKDPSMLEHVQKELGVIGFWSSMGIKGWRLDVPNDINRPEFWREFRTLVKTIDPEIWLVGEIWDNDEEANWINNERFDAIMNYRFWQWAQDYLVGKTEERSQHLSGSRAANIDASWLGRNVSWFTSRHPKNVVRSMMNNIGSHDIPRLADLLKEKTALGLLILMTLPGVPSIWAGDENGMENSNEAIILDPNNRKPFEWDINSLLPKVPENETFSLVKVLSDLRESHSGLRSSRIHFVDTNDPDLLVYKREAEEDQEPDTLLVAVNRSTEPKTLPKELLTSKSHSFEPYLATHNQAIESTGSISIIPGGSGVIYTNQ